MDQIGMELTTMNVVVIALILLTIIAMIYEHRQFIKMIRSTSSPNHDNQIKLAMNGFGPCEYCSRKSSTTGLCDGCGAPN